MFLRMNRLLLGSLLLLGIGCDRRMTATAPPSAASGGARFLALGDSYTIGQSVDASQRWPVQLAAMLRGEGIAIADPTIIARTGWTTDELSHGIDAAAPQGRYDLVGLLIGVNNQYRGLSSSAYRVEFVALLQRAIGFAGGAAPHVIVLSIPDWGATPFAAGQDRLAIGREIDVFNDIARDETQKAGARFIDVTPGSRRAAQEADLVAEDGLHPSGKMYGQWAKLALPEARAALRRS